MSTLAHEWPSETNSQADQQVEPGVDRLAGEGAGANVATLPSVETHLTDAEKVQQLVAKLESLMFQDTNILTNELREQGVFIEDFEGDNEGLGILAVSEGWGNRLYQNLWIDYSRDEDAITAVKLENSLHRIEDKTQLSQQTFEWGPESVPSDEIIRAVDLVSTRVEQARAMRKRRIEAGAGVSHEVMRRAVEVSRHLN